jgi:hypothetical protein
MGFSFHSPGYVKRAKMPDRKPRHQRVAARGKDQRKTCQGEAMTKTPGEVEPFKPITKAVRDAPRHFAKSMPKRQ